ncbi:hypothetical protein EI94DRAFT_1811209 [Lactarius quietus]|nr:hypothetical protein EI94DRAFT_1811209 [Lactarius quietus]
MSNAPIPPSPGPSRTRPGYGAYQPAHGNSLYGNGAANSGRFRGDSWRSEPTYRPRDPHADHYEPDYGDDRPRLGWGAGHAQPQTYDPSSDLWQRRDLMAERMFEPSESWKHGYVPDSELEVTERFSEPRTRMPPPREDYAYAYGGDSYRAGNSYMSRRDLAYQRTTDYYRPGYPEEGRWGSSFPLDDASNWTRQRSPSTTSRPRGRSDCRDMSYERSLSERLLRPHPPFAPLESGQNLHRDLATILDPRCGLLLVLARILQILLYDRPFSEAILWVNHGVGVVARD